MPKGFNWQGGPDPAGDPEKFAPQPSDFAFDLIEWRWADNLTGNVSAEFGGKTLGFKFLFVLSNGNSKDGVEVHSFNGGGKPRLVRKHEWMIPPGHPTREIALIACGDPTDNLVRHLQDCFSWPPVKIKAIPENGAVVGNAVVLRGLVEPETGRFTTRMKVILGADTEGYCEFVLNVNSQTKKVWLLEKASDYRPIIINWLARPDTDSVKGDADA